MTYNVPMVNLDVASQLAVAYIESRIIPFLVGAPGVGKTTIAQRVANRLNAELRAIRLNNIAPEEVNGLQFVDSKENKSVHLPPKWMPNPDGSDGPVLIFIDEITQAADENRKAIMSALLERYLGDTKLPDNCYFMAAGNSAEDGTNVYEFDRATADRFGVIKIKTDVESWCNDYAPANDIDISIVAFLRIRPDKFEMSEELAESDNVVGASPRTWEALSRFLKTCAEKGYSAQVLEAGVMGKIGNEVGTAFMSVRDQVTQLKSIKQLLAMNYEDRQKHTPQTLEALWTYCQGMIWYADTVERCEQVYELLDSFKEVKDVPFYETRFTVGEMLLNRAINVHGLKDVFRSKTMQQLTLKWRDQMNNCTRAVPDATESAQGEELKFAA